MKDLKDHLRHLSVLCCICSTFFLLFVPTTAQASNVYGGGTYGDCQYGSCGITLTSSGIVTDTITPGTTTTCSVQSDSVSVMTDSDAGYTLSLNDTAANSQLNGSNSGDIAASQGSRDSPGQLGVNTWGYRVDGIGKFGAGPTIASMNSGVLPLAFAGVPNTLAAPDVIASSATAADPAVTTPVWYGACANTSLPSGTYSSGVTYTAVAN